MRYFWGGLSLFAFVVAVGGLLVITNGGNDNALFGGIVAIMGLLTAYFSAQLRRRYR